MGSYAYALTPKERWSVATYVKRLSMMDSLGNLPVIKAIGVVETATTAVIDSSKSIKKMKP